MACYKPITAWKPLEGGAIHFSEKKNCVEIQIKCGQCIGCRIAKREAWAIRCFAESKMHLHNHFLTFTYNEENFPQYGSLNYRHFQLFMHKARKALGSFRFFMCGEYGENTSRPHYHALFFGLDIPDLRKCNSVFASDDIFESETISRLWGKGNVTIGSVTYESARYCAVYTCKKVTGDLAESHYSRVDPLTGEIVRLVPEFAHMSLRPGIGMPWLEKYWPDIYLSGANGFVVNGKVKPTPKYFDDKMEVIAPKVIDDTKIDRLHSVDHANNTFDRLAVRHAVAKSKERFNKERNLSNAL